MRNSRFLVVGLIVLVLVPCAAEAKGIRVNWTFSGAVLQNLAKAADFSDPTLVTGRTVLFQVQAHGSPGRAQIIGINQSFLPTDVAGDLEGCFEGADVKLVGGLSENSLVARFNDLSILNIVKDNDAADPSFSCFDFDTGRFDATVQVEFNGGFGRFENATGNATIRLTSGSVGLIQVGEDPDVFLPSDLASEVGTITGWLYMH